MAAANAAAAARVANDAAVAETVERVNAEHADDWCDPWADAVYLAATDSELLEAAGLDPDEWAPMNTWEDEAAAAAAWPAVGAAAVAAVREEAAAAYNSVPLSVDEARRDLSAWAVISTRSAERLAAAVVADREAFEALVANGGVRAESRLFAAAAAAIDELASARDVAAADARSLVKARAALEAAELAAPYPPVSTAPVPSAAERAAVRAAAAAVAAKRAAAGFSL